MKVLRLLVQRIQLQESLAEEARLAQLSQFVVGVGDVVDALVRLEAVVNQRYTIRDSNRSHFQRSRSTSPIHTFLGFSPRRKRN